MQHDAKEHGDDLQLRHAWAELTAVAHQVAHSSRGVGACLLVLILQCDTERLNGCSQSRVQGIRVKGGVSNCHMENMT